jgi:DNA-binding MarR family transcriptional regulator
MPFNLVGRNQERFLIFMLLVVFIITEAVDDLLDNLLGSSLVHSGLQLILFLMLFSIVARIFLHLSRNKVTKLIPEELMSILRIIKEAESNCITVNLRDIRSKLGITKPTLKKRIDQLIRVEYITFEKDGNSKYLRITPLGRSLLK